MCGRTRLKRKRKARVQAESPTRKERYCQCATAGPATMQWWTGECVLRVGRRTVVIQKLKGKRRKGNTRDVLRCEKLQHAYRGFLPMSNYVARSQTHMQTQTYISANINHMQLPEERPLIDLHACPSTVAIRTRRYCMCIRKRANDARVRCSKKCSNIVCVVLRQASSLQIQSTHS